MMTWKPSAVLSPVACPPSNRRRRWRALGWPVWPIHDLLTTELLVWIFPTNIFSHLVQFFVITLLLWGGCCFSAWQIAEEFMKEDGPEKIELEDHVWLMIYVMMGLSFVAVSVIWVYRYHQSTLYILHGNPKPWMNPQVPAIRRKEMHVPLRLFDSAVKARRAACLPHMVAWNETPVLFPNRRSRDPLTFNIIKLDGTWQFQLLFEVEEALDLVQQDARRWDATKDTDDASWSPIQVPGHWMLQGFPDIPIYTNKKYPIPCNPPIVPRRNPTGVYRLEVDYPEEIWTSDDDYSILLHGFESACYVYWNGHCLGFAKDSRLPSEFAIPTAMHRRGRRGIFHVVVIRWSDGSYMEDQDHWWMAGLHRSVELVRRPARADILDYRVQATVSRELTVAVRLRPNTSRRRLTVRLLADHQVTADGDQWRPASEELWSETKAADASSTTVDFQSKHIPKVQLWTAETPNLYTLLLIQSDEITGRTIQAESCRVGFRSVEIATDGILRVNGRPITICGINRHEHDPDHGKAVSLDRMKQDIVVLKQNNFNAIRTSHYPTHSSFYRLCDFYGMYVCDEANVETDGMKPMGRLANDRWWEPTFVSRVQRTVERDYNHACIIFWSLGNESGRGSNLFKARKTILESDRSRPICYEGGGSWAEGEGNTELTDIVCPMYPSVPTTEKIALSSNEDRPLILCEYSHSMNNSNGNLHLYWKAFWNPRYPRLQGGFIWDMIDQGLRKRDKNGRYYYAYGGDFGDIINDRQFCINGMFSPEREPHPCVSEIKYLQQPVALSIPNGLPSVGLKVSRGFRSRSTILLDVSNRYCFRGLGHLSWKWNLVLEFYSNEKFSGEATLRGDVLEIALSSLALFRLYRLQLGRVGDVFLNVKGMLSFDTTWANAGYVLAKEQFPVSLEIDNVSQTSDNILPRGGLSTRSFLLSICPASNGIDSELVVSEDSSSIAICKFGSQQPFVVIGKMTGAMKTMNLSRKRNVLHVQGMQPCYTRATTDNDRGGMELALDFLSLSWLRSAVEIFYKHLFSYAIHWKDFGLNMDSPPVNICSQCKVLSEGAATGNVVVEVKCLTTCSSSGRTILSTNLVYTIFSDNKIKLDVKVVPSESIQRIPSLPRIGLSLVVNPDYCKVKYFGRGPDENYPDRKSRSPMGVWETLPSRMGYDYIVPSENGSRSDCRWAVFESDGEGFIVATDSDTFSFSALLHSAEELNAASHTCDLEPHQDGKDPIYVHLDHQLMGLGGDVSWFPCVYPEYLVQTKEYEYSLWFLGFDGGESPESVITRTMSQ